MPQKGQLTKHEWSEWHYTGKWVSICFYCEVERSRLTYTGITQYSLKGASIESEPKCITRGKEKAPE